jgi:hypothetical protein
MAGRTGLLCNRYSGSLYPPYIPADPPETIAPSFILADPSFIPEEGNPPYLAAPQRRVTLRFSSSVISIKPLAL